MIDRRTAIRVAAPILLLLLAAAGIWLVITGGQDEALDAEPNTVEGGHDALELRETDQDSVTALAGLAFPPSTTGFLTARFDDDSQLDVTFLLEPGEESDFVDASGLSEPVLDQRVITHSSPLWKLNPDGPVRGVEDSRDGVHRKVELVEEDGLTRVRVEITPVQ